MSVVNLAAACPTGEVWISLNSMGLSCSVNSGFNLKNAGGVIFSDEVISWHIPYRVTPLLDGNFKIMEMHMGINGQRLDKSQMAARGYRLSTTDFHIVLEIPVGSTDGYYKVGTPDLIFKTLVTGPLACFIKMPWIIAEPCPRLPVPHDIHYWAHAWGVMEDRERSWWHQIQGSVSNYHPSDADYTPSQRW